MKNVERYHFADFTRDNYRFLLSLAQRNYTFRTYQDFQSPGGPFILLRHDLDFSVHAARKMAHIEAEAGVVATYFVRLHSEFYNLLEREISHYLIEILELGHHLGLHFDCSYYDIRNEEQLEKLILWEEGILQDLFKREIHAFSFHNPSAEMLRYGNLRYAGLINTYAEYFQKNMTYCSDSNGYWRFRRLEDLLREAQAERLQILIHPEMWQDTLMSPKERIYRCIDGRAARAKRFYDQILMEGQRENIDWE